MDIVEKLRSQIGDDVQHIFDREALFRLAAEEIERLRGEISASHRREEEAWCRCNHAETKVKGWEATMIVRGLPMRALSCAGWGPGEGDQVEIPMPTPEKITDILDRLAAAEHAQTGET